MMSGIGKARPALLAAGHCWAQQDSIQGGPLGAVVFAAAAIRAAAQSMVRVIYDFSLLGNFRFGVLFGHFLSLPLLRRVGYRCHVLPQFC